MKKESFEIWLVLLMWYDILYKHLSSLKNSEEAVFRGELFILSYVFTRIICPPSRIVDFYLDYLKIWKNEFFSEWEKDDLPYLVSSYIQSNFSNRTDSYHKCISSSNAATAGCISELCDTIGYLGKDQDNITNELLDFGAFLMHQDVRYVEIEMCYMELYFDKLYEKDWLIWNDYRLSLLREGKEDDIVDFHSWKLGKKISEQNVDKIYSLPFSGNQKFFLCLAGGALLLLVIAIVATLTETRIPYGFFVFLRIVTFGALIGLMLEKLPQWLKFIFVLLAILYNPLIRIHLGDREIWALFNALTIPALIVPWFVIWKRLRKL